MLCGLMEILVTPCVFMLRSLPSVMLSGRPASTVNSFDCSIGRYFSVIAIKRSNCSSDNDVGVPPPTYTLTICLPASHSLHCVISFSKASRYASILSRYLPAGKEEKEQYAQIVGQKGMPMYTFAHLSCCMPCVRENSFFATSIASFTLSSRQKYSSFKISRIAVSSCPCIISRSGIFAGRIPVRIPHGSSFPDCVFKYS